MWWEKDENWRRTWGYDFKWTPEHRTKEELKPLMYSYDRLATECLDILDEISPPPKGPQNGEKPPNPEKAPSSEPPPPSEETPSSEPPAAKPKPPSPFHRDYHSLLRDHHPAHPRLSLFWDQLTTIPPWVDPSQIARGQSVFYRYAGPAIVGLTFQSLLGGMGGYRVVETLSRTGGFGVRVARRRLLETFQHILLVTRDLESVMPGGEGWVSSVKVRFLHASVRRRIMQLAKGEGEKADGEGDKEKEGKGRRYYDVQEHGVPVNDLDSIGTIAAFSATLIWVSFPRQGIYLTAQEKEDFIALWRYVAYLLGTPTEGFFETVTQARAVMESLMMTEIDPSPTSRVLANNIISALANAPPKLASEAFLRAETRWLNGWELSDALDVPRVGIWYTVLVGAQCVFFMAVCYTSRMVPAWDRRRVEGLKRRMRNITVSLAGGGEATHEFRYVPGLDVNTAREEAKEGEVGRPVERRNVKALAVTGMVIAAVAWLGLRYASGMFQKV